jgi:hypothetical protein
MGRGPPVDDGHLQSRCYMRLLIAIVVAAVIPVSLSSEQPRLPDPGALGPFAIGHTSLLLTDARPDPSVPNIRGTRRIGVGPDPIQWTD